MSELIREWREGRTSDKDRYLDTWFSHINELKHIGSPLIDASEVTEHYDKLLVIMEDLRQLVKIAADQDFD